MQANGRLQRWNSRGLRPQGLVEAAARKRPRGARGMQRWNSRGLRPQGLVEAAARKRPRGALGMDARTTEGYAGKRPAEHLKRFKRLKAGKRQASTP